MLRAEAHRPTGTAFSSSLHHLDYRSIGTSYHDLTRRVYVAYIHGVLVRKRLVGLFLPLRPPDSGVDKAADSSLDLKALAAAQKNTLSYNRVSVPEVPSSITTGASLADRIRIVSEEEWARLLMRNSL